MPDDMMAVFGDAAAIIEQLGMARHPEGGWYVETFRDAPRSDGRPISTAIYFLLERGDVSAWHRVRDAVEVWHFHDGAPLDLTLWDPVEGTRSVVLGAGLGSGQRPQAIVPAGTWQRAESRGAWTLVGCTVAPGFVFEAFELAEPGWEPPA